MTLEAGYDVLVYPLNYCCFLSAVDLQVNFNVSYSSPVLVLDPPSYD